jgi:hypothetical protein
LVWKNRKFIRLFLILERIREIEWKLVIKLIKWKLKLLDNIKIKNFWIWRRCFRIWVEFELDWKRINWRL